MTDAEENDTVYTYVDHPGASPFAPPGRLIATIRAGRGIASPANPSG